MKTTVLSIFILVIIAFTALAQNPDIENTVPVLRLTYTINTPVDRETWISRLTPEQEYFTANNILESWKSALTDLEAFRPGTNPHSSVTYFPSFGQVINEITFKDHTLIDSIMVTLRDPEQAQLLLYGVNMKINPGNPRSFTKFEPSTFNVPKTCINGVRDGDESAEDCGGSCSPCNFNDGCRFNDDCGAKQSDIPPSNECSGTNPPVECAYSQTRCDDALCDNACCDTQACSTIPCDKTECHGTVCSAGVCTKRMKCSFFGSSASTASMMFAVVAMIIGAMMALFY